MQPPNVPIIPLDKVQGIILRGYEVLEHAFFVLLQITDAAAAKRWLAGLAPQLTNATHKPHTHAVNVAFTWEGLKLLLQRKDDELKGFSREFQEGMDTDHRQRVLGDTGSSAPPNWDWGSQSDVQRLHVLLMLYGKHASELQTLYDAQKPAYEAEKLVEIRRLATHRLRGRKEHFGFRDGIAQPFLEGVLKEPPTQEQEPPIPGNTLKAGEMLLGYDNEYQKSPVSPAIPAPDGKGFLDFGRNGSYLVFRQLSQNVRAFWQFVDQSTAAPGLSPEEHAKARVKLAAKMVGRWPSGAPLVLRPEADDPALRDEDKFAYSATDSLGTSCPIGAHIRRSNPRDSLEPGPGTGRLSPEESARVTNLHRIMRRGREYGPPVAESMEPADILAAPVSAEEPDRGLYFICFNANIARQFEFVQQTWVNNPKFGGLYADSDPLMGQRHPLNIPPADTFTWQDNPVRRRFTGLPEFVRVRGGGYFFMPGVDSVKYLAGLLDRLEPTDPLAAD
jgi:Dyp-type peroxidase family